VKRFTLVFVIATCTVAWSADTTKLSPDVQQSTAQTAQVVVQYNIAPGPLDLKLLATLGPILN